MVLVDDRRAFGQFAEVADDRFGLAADALAPARLRGALREELALGQDRARRGVGGEAVVERRDGDGECRVVRRIQRGEHVGLQGGRGQHFQQGLAAAGRFRGDHHLAVEAAQERLERGAGLDVVLAERQVGHRLHAERHRVGESRVAARAHFDALALVQSLAQRDRRQVQRLGRQQRAFGIVAALLIALAGLQPELVGGLVHAFADQGQRAFGQVVEQGRGALALAIGGEEQRQPGLDAGGCEPVLQILVEHRLARVDAEIVAQRVHRALAGGLVHRDFAAGQQLHGLDLVGGALRLGIERADRFDLVIEQFDAIRRVDAHWIDIQQAAAHGEIARIEHLRDMAIAGRFKPAFLGVQVQPMADVVVEAAADHVRYRRQALQQRLHRHHDDAAALAGQPVQRGQALRDDVRMRAEAVVGQRFPVRKRQQRQVGGVAEQGAQVGFELVRLLVVGGDQQDRRLVRAGGLRHRPGEA